MTAAASRDLLPRRALCALGALAICSLACFSSKQKPVQVQPAPMEDEASEQRLATLLVGQWEHKETRQSASSGRMSGEEGMVWGLNSGSRFVYQQRSLFSGGVTGEWWLDGRNLHFRADGTGTLSAYRVEEWSSGRMVWYSYREKTYYMVERAGLIQASFTDHLGRP